MKTAALIIPVIFAQVATANITPINDNRGALISIGLYDQAAPEDFYQTATPESPFSIFTGALQGSLFHTSLGNASANIEYQSTITNSTITSNANISAVSEGFESYAVVDAGVFDRFNFTIQQTTVLHIQGTISASGLSASSFIEISDISNPTPSNIYIDAVSNDTLYIDQLLTLDPSTYNFSLTSSIFLLVGESGESYQSNAAHNIAVTIVPAPSSLLIPLLGLIPLANRRR